MSIYHTHHIVPRHMGGTDDPSNLVRLTIEEHAEAHKKLYVEYGKEEDRIAWLALSGQMTMAEASKNAIKLGSIKGIATQKRLKSERGEWYKNNAETISKSLKIYISENGSWWTGKTHSESTKKKIGKKNAVSQSGCKNSQHGTMWITNRTKNMKIKKTDIIPSGWIKGRTMCGE